MNLIITKVVIIMEIIAIIIIMAMTYFCIALYDSKIVEGFVGIYNLKILEGFM